MSIDPPQIRDVTGDPSGGTGEVPADHVPVVRRVKFDYADVPVHWVDGAPMVTHVANAFNVLLPPGERMFCRTFREALPRVEDGLLRDQVKAFIAQEAIHGRSHHGYIEHLAEEGWPVDRLMASFDRRAEFLDTRVPLKLRLWLIASIEIYTAMLAGYAFDTGLFDDAHPEMRDLFLWHLAEEAEHKSVAHDLASAIDPSRVRQMVAGVIVFVGIVLQPALVMVRLLRWDPEMNVRRSVRELWRERGQLIELARRGVRSFRASLRRDFHPSQIPDPPAALAYFADSPAVASLAAR
ncbi:metal-dependent hydrolase [Actinospongicola halichondriae]|uniref:metal-dependent hydrolase n=1 Tax=Actinospongicola halichondriae TaxID=3236844 RepID=UPI003D4550AA